VKRTTRILIADDHPLFREALRGVIDSLFLSAEVTEVRTFADTVRTAMEGERFDLVFFDLIMPGSSDALAEFAWLRRSIPETPFLVVSSRDDRETVEGVLALGAAAFIAKSAAKTEIEQAIRQVLAGDVYRPVVNAARRESPEGLEPLSPRQTEVLALLACGRSNREIAGDLNVEEFTVKAHISAILRKLHVKSRLEAVVVSRSFVDNR
jgi:DNA-binding NarL/FixJ family response regulator